MNRRGFLRGLLAGAAISTGLGRYRLELVDDALTWDTAPGADRTVAAWWGARPRVDQPAAGELDEQLAAVLEQAWRDCTQASDDPPDFIYCDERTLRLLEIYHA